MENLQIKTVWKDESASSLKTVLVESECKDLLPGEILVEMFYVPIHGSFWLASHPQAIHPRIDEFMKDGGFVFGNGGVGKVVMTNLAEGEVEIGDYVCIYGHSPCNNYDCYACKVLHRYTECDYNEGKIIGHGKSSYNGTYSKYVILPKYSYEICFKAHEKPAKKDLMPFMYGFLLADVRNALTRHQDTLRMGRMLLVGAGQSGQLAAYLHSNTCPESKIFLVDASVSNISKVKDIKNANVKTFVIPSDIAEQLNKNQKNIGFRQELKSVIHEIKKQMREHFNNRNCNLIFDSSSGNGAPLWDNEEILAPSSHCIVFGFGSEYVLLTKEIIQISGLNIMTSRGVGNIRNRKEVIELIKAGANDFIYSQLISNAKELKGIDEAIEFVNDTHESNLSFHEIEQSYISFK